MSAELLRKAATIVRERAERVEPGPWERADNVHGVVVRVGSNWPIGDDDAVTSTDGYAVAEWIAMMHPGVGLALADWLDDEATFSRVQITEYAATLARLIVGEEWR